MNLFEREWLELFMLPEDRAVWLRAGLEIHEAGIARACVEAGIRPTQLLREVDGRTVVLRLAEGESAAHVKALLDEEDRLR